MRSISLIVALLLLPVSLEAAPNCSCTLRAVPARVVRAVRSIKPIRRAFGIFRNLRNR